MGAVIGALLAFCLTCASVAAIAPAANVTQVLPPFTAVKDSLPFGGSVIAGPNDTTYDITLIGPFTTSANFKVKKNTTLDLKMPKGPPPINATAATYVLRLPAGYLAEYKQSGAGATVVDGAVANTTQFVVSASGAAKCSVANVTSKLVNATLSGVGKLEVNASTQGAGIDVLGFSALGAGTGHVNGVSKLLEVDIAGIANLYVSAGSDSLVINGTAVGISTVYYDKGTCAVTCPIPFRSVCVQQPMHLALPVA